MKGLKSHFTDEELIIILEAARIAMADEDISAYIGEETDLSFDEMLRISDKVHRFMGERTITGWKAIEYAAKHGYLTLSKFDDPVEGPRHGLSVEEATEVAKEDPGLIYLKIM